MKVCYILIHEAKLLCVLSNMRVKLNKDRKRKKIAIDAINKPPRIPLLKVRNDYAC